MNGPYNSGTPINLVERFWLIDPITEVATLADPTTVTFTLEAPDGTLTDYVFGIDGNVTHPSVGTYVCEVGPLDPGTYVYRAVGTGAVQAESAEKSFLVYESTIDPGVDLIPTPGPIEPWISGDDVAACGPSLGVGSNTWLLDNAAADGSMIMFELLGRKFNGIVTRRVRPCADSCGCWDVASGMALWSWTSNPAYGGWWGWRNENGRTCGCDPLSRVRLAGWPVRQIVQIKIDGVVLPRLDDNGNPNYRLDRHRELVRMDDPSGTSVTKRYWPGCQNLALADSEAGTFSVLYKWGQEAPSLAQAAAAVLARELYKACSGDGKCALPSKVTKIARQGVTMDRVVAVADLLRAGSSGLQIVDAAIAAFNPTKQRRSAAVFSPDVQRFARPEGIV